MKKALMILLSLAVILSAIGTVAADTVATPNGPKIVAPASGNYFSVDHEAFTEVSYSVSAEKYVITIPGQINFQSDAKWTSNLIVTDVTLASGRSLDIYVQSEHDFYLVQHETNGDPILTKNITYEMGYILLGGTVGKANKDNAGPILLLDLPAGVSSGTVPLTFNMTSVAPELGTYKDELTFTARVSGPLPSSQ